MCVCMFWLFIVNSFFITLVSCCKQLHYVNWKTDENCLFYKSKKNDIDGKAVNAVRLLRGPWTTVKLLRLVETYPSLAQWTIIIIYVQQLLPHFVSVDSERSCDPSTLQ